MVRLEEKTPKEYQKFHGLQEAYIVRVVEGEGTAESVMREVIYVFDTNLVEIGKIDWQME
jgi:hypothetical protein